MQADCRMFSLQEAVPAHRGSAPQVEKKLRRVVLVLERP
jgi:hypothetical protein